METPDRAPFFIPPWFLTMKYVLLAVLGLVVIYATAPSLNLTIGDSLSTIWGSLLFIASSLAAIASVASKGEGLERWSGAAVVVLLVVYAVSPALIILTTGDPDRLAYSVTAFGLAMFPALRTVDLLSRTGLKWAKRKDEGDGE